MRLSAFCLLGSLAALKIPLSAGAVPAQSTEAVSAQWRGQKAVTAPQGKLAADICPPGYYWEPDGYAPHGKFRLAHCARRCEQRLSPGAPISLAPSLDALENGRWSKICLCTAPKRETRPVPRCARCWTTQSSPHPIR